MERPGRPCEDGVKAQEHRALGDEASGGATVNLGGESAEERLVVRFGDVVAQRGLLLSHR